MKTAIVEIEIPYQQDAPMRRWHELRTLIDERIKKTEGVQELAPNVWIIPLDSNLPFFGLLVCGARERDLKSRSALLDEPLRWIES